MQRLAIAAMLAAALASPAPAEALTPFYGRCFLVAGTTNEGLKDGGFLQAAFRQPGALVVSADARRLYVADAGNHAIRSVALDGNNRVETLAGGGKPGAADGKGATAGLDHPDNLFLFDRGEWLGFLDRGSRHLRLLNLKTRLVRSFLRSLPSPGAPDGQSITVSDLAYSPLDERVYFHDPDAGELRVLDLRQGLLRRLGVPGDYAPESCRLAVAGRSLCYYNPDQGLLKRVLFGGKEAADLDLKAAELPAPDPRILPLRVPGGVGFQGLEAAPGKWRLLLWDPGSASLKWIDPANGAVEEYPLGDVTGQALSGPSPAGDRPLPGSAPARAAFRGPLRFAYSPAAKAFYISESQSGRLLGLRDVEWWMKAADHNPKGLRDFDLPYAKPPGVTRILWISNSIGYEGPPPDQQLNRERRLATQFELYLNLLSALDGNGRRYEVLCRAECGTCMGGGPAGFFLAQGELLKAYQVDQVLIILNSYSIAYELSAIERTRTVDDVPVLPEDREWLLADAAEQAKSFGPITRRILAFAARHQRVNEDGKLFGGYEYGFFSDPEYQALALDLERHLLRKGAALAGAHGARLNLAYLPVRTMVGLGEDPAMEMGLPETLSGGLRALAKSLGLGYVDIVDEMRLVDPVFFPLYADGSNTHLTERGHQWAAYLLARKYLARP